MDNPTPQDSPAAPTSTSALMFGPGWNPDQPAGPQGPSGASEGQPATQGQEIELEEATDPLEALTEDIWAGPSSPGAYRFGQVPAGVGVDINQELAFRTFFHEEGIPEGIGSELGRRWNEAVVRESVKPQTRAQQELSRRACEVYLRNAWGEDAQRNFEVAHAEVKRLSAKMPQLGEMLDLSGMGNDPWVVMSLFNLARGKGRVK